MLLLLNDWLRDVLVWKIPTVFTYFSTRMALAAITSLLISIFLGPPFIRKLYELKIGQSIRKEDCPLLGELHHKKQDTPTMGGLLILFSIFISALLWMDLTHIFTWILLISMLVLGLLGARDDYLKLKYRNPKGLTARRKLLAQLILSGVIAFLLLLPSVPGQLYEGWFKVPVVKEQVSVKAVKGDTEGSSTLKVLSLREYASRIYAPFFKEPIIVFSGLGVIAAGFFIAFVITGASNAVNLTDGLDGLAAGCIMMVAACLALIAFVSNNLEIATYLRILYIEGSGEIAIFLSALIGATLGFLWYNCFPAQMFMGDTGSLALGGVIGVSAVLLRRELLLALVGGIFVAEALSVILQVGSYKLRNKRRIFLCAPLHHHFEYKGWPETKVVMRFWIIALLLAIIGVTSLKFQ